MLIEYVEEALRLARYEIIEDEEPYYGEVPELKGVWATGKTLEECREHLKDVIEGWILVSLRRNLPVPRLGKCEIKEIQAAVGQMSKLTAVSFNELVRKLRALGFEGPLGGGKHLFMVKEDLRLTVPNPHRQDIGVDLLKRILRRGEIDRDEWIKA